MIDYSSIVSHTHIIEHDACVVEGIRSFSFFPLLPSSLGNRLRGEDYEKKEEEKETKHF